MVTDVFTAVDKLLSSLELDEAAEANASIARALARKLDEAGSQDSGTIAMAISGIAKELRATIEAVLQATGATEEWVADLFSAVGDSSHA